MGDYFNLYRVEDLKLVDVRKYCGVEDGRHAWIFLGYDVVRTGENGQAISILTDDVKEYDYLKLTHDERNRQYYDHTNIVSGDVRVKEHDGEALGIFGKGTVVSRAHIKTWIDEHSDFYFLNYSPAENEKVKSKQLTN